MPRDIPVGNGSLLVNFDSTYQLRDLYWPHVGLENHTAGHPFRLGVWVDGQFSWVSQDDWQRRLEYEPATLVTNVSLVNNKLGLRLLAKDVVDFHENLYLRQITVHNDRDQEREIRLFFSHDFHIGGYEVGDSAYYEPERKALFHYKGKRWFLINAARGQGEEFTLGLDQWAVGIKELGGNEGTWRDAEDGWLSGNAVAQGSVDSTGALHLLVPGHGEAKGWYWIAVGEDFDAVIRINRNIRERGPDSYLERTRQYWKLWSNKEPDDALGLSPELTDLYRRSLLVVRSQIDNDGAIIAASDYDITTFARDTYSYMWPRDGALVSAALIDAGYSEVTRRFFEFCHNVVTPEGYLLHKYTPDGALASSWHAWYRDGQKQLPVQEDESALVLWALWKHFERFRDVEFVKPLYRGLIIRVANWLMSYRDENDGLPLPSWDLWEERRGVLSWTVASTQAGLQAAGNFADAFGEAHLAARYRKAADEIKAGVEKQLWHPDLNRFVRMINRREDGVWDVDTALDSSLFGLWYFGMFPADDPRVVSTMKAIQDHLWIKTDVGGAARYENDYYHQVSDDKTNVPGNPWFICTLWLAEWQIAVAKSEDDLKPALDILNWTASHTLQSGVMAEQVHPYSGEPLSVSPLTWSHATLVLTIRELLAKQNSINLKKKE
ncbi:MAG: glycoside hydrolase family 15 protein [Chloroflexi bacterium]|nr:glycoside hydrolase family 15 protein [Chloroflexota bacterium]MBI5964128.1 glycoside hydrolase family 15 protein [Chloroflexota bacterium]